MSVYLENEYMPEGLGDIFSFDVTQTAGQVIGAALDHEGCPFDAEVNVLLTGNEGIREMNKETRDIDAVTDVLSFPMNDFEEPADFSSISEDDPECFDMESGELLLGDIVICVPRVIEQAEAYGHSRRREFAFLIAHSMLHLMGYDHMTPEEETEMFRRQEEILSSIGITREA